MNKKFYPVKAIFVFLTLAIVLIVITCIIWIFARTSEVAQPIIVLLLLAITIGIPMLIRSFFRYVFLKIDENSVTCDVFDGKTDNFGWIEEIENIKSIKITTREECRQYYKNCHSKKVILIDFGNGNIKYIALQWFTKKQSQVILQTINERLEALKTNK